MNFTQPSNAISSVIDLDRYPIHAPESLAYQNAMSEVQADLDAYGCAVLKRFVRPDALEHLVVEADRVAPLAHRLPSLYEGLDNSHVHASCF